VKHTPATPLPWHVGAVAPSRFPAYPIVSDVIVANVSIRARGGSNKDAAYIAHAANLYGVLVESLKEIRTTTTDRACVPIIEEALAKAGEQ
jgi:hypothetical protein